MSKTLLFDMSAGVSGDMILGGLLALGMDPEVVNSPLRSLGLPVSLETEPVSLHGLQAIRARVQIREKSPPQRQLRDFLEWVEKLPVSAEAKTTATRIFTRLAEAESTVHGIPVSEVHFHEIGGMDTFVDVVGAVLGIQALEIRECLTTDFPFGRGMVTMEHGTLPEPVPATVNLTKGFSSYRTGWDGEHCTPTGAAIVTSLAKPVTPDWKAVLCAVGYGAGTREYSNRANVLRLCLYENSNFSDSEHELYQIECNLDNSTPEQAAFAAEKLMESGCLDAWQEALIMKKGRAGVKLCALADGQHREKALRIIASETPAGGLRWFPVRRIVGRKSSQSLETSVGIVATKEIEFPVYAVWKTGAEYESARELAKASGTPLHEIQSAVSQSPKNGLRP